MPKSNKAKTPLKDLKVKKEVKGGCGCMGMGQDPGKAMLLNRVQPADLKISSALVTKTIVR